MREKLFVVILALMLISCGISKNINLPDKDLKIDKGEVLFKDKKYTGKLNLAGKYGYLGFVTLKDGKLEGTSEIKNDEKNLYTKFTIINNKFEGEVIVKNKDQNLDMTANYSSGKLIRLSGDFSEGVKYDLTFVNGLANGWFENGGEKFLFSDGMISISEDDFTTDIKYYVNQETGDMGMEFYIDGKSVAKEEKPNKVFNIEYFKLVAISSVLESNVPKDK